MEQLAIPEECYVPVSQIISYDREVDAAMRWLVEWLIETHHCDRAIRSHVERLYREFDRARAMDRAKGLIALCTVDGWSLEDAEYMGVYDHSITDYHVIWDRAWAIRMLVPRELVPKVWKCGYGGRPKFWDRDGKLLFQSIYTANSHVLTTEERRQALAERGETWD